MFKTEIDSQGIEAINAQVQATEKQIKLAFNKAATTTTSWMRRTAKQMITQGLKLRSGAVLKRRIIVRRRSSKGLTSFQFWVGVNDLRIEDFKGRASQSGKGVRLGEHFIEGGFFMRTKSGKRIVMQRSADPRLPVERVTAPIEDEARAIIDKIYREANGFFLKSYRQELYGMIARGYGY